MVTPFSVLSLLPAAVAIVPVPPSVPPLMVAFSRSSVPVVASISPWLVMVPVRSSVPTAAVTLLPPAMVTPFSVLSLLPAAVAIVPAPPSVPPLMMAFSRSSVPPVASISPLLVMVPVRSSVPTAAVTCVPPAIVTPFSVLSLLPAAVAIVPAPPSVPPLMVAFSRSSVPVVASISPCVGDGPGQVQRAHRRRGSRRDVAQLPP